ncbi:MAG: hypothetical protein V1809_11000 [Planctomycetota bacterium]
MNTHDANNALHGIVNPGGLPSREGERWQHGRKGNVRFMVLSDYIARIAEVARKAKSESKLEGEFNQILRECLHEFGIPFDPHIRSV